MTTLDSAGDHWLADGDVPAHDRIELLARLVAAAPHAQDRAELTGMLGCAWLERYEQECGQQECGQKECGEEAFRTGAAHLHEAIESWPEHPARAQWHFALGLGHAIRAGARRSVDDYDLAIEWFGTSHARMPADEAADDAIVALADAYWDRFWLLRYHSRIDRPAGIAEADRLVAALAAMRPTGLATSLYVRMTLGLSRMERYDLTDSRADLDGAVALLDAPVADLPAQTPRLCLAAAELARAHRTRAVLDDDPRSLDASIRVGAAALERTGANQALVVLMLREGQALGHELRWRAGGDRVDLDRAINWWQVLLAGGAEMEADSRWAAHCGDLLRARGELTGDPAEVAEAVGLLERATRTAPDDPDAWLRWYELGRAHHAQWTLTRLPDSLDSASRSLDHTLDLGVPSDDELLRVHVRRVSVGYAVLEQDSHDTAIEPPASAARLRSLLREGRDALWRCLDADVGLRSMLALMIGLGEMWEVSHDRGRFDADRVGALIGIAVCARPVCGGDISAVLAAVLATWDRATVGDLAAAAELSQRAAQMFAALATEPSARGRHGVGSRARLPLRQHDPAAGRAAA